MRIASAATPILLGLLVCAVPAKAAPDIGPYPAAQSNTPCDMVERGRNETDALNCQSLDRIQASQAAAAQMQAPQEGVIAAGTGMTAPESIATPQPPASSGRWYKGSDRR